MAQCKQCRRKKVNVSYYQGIAMCSSCMNIYNPKTKVISQLSINEINYKKQNIAELEESIRKSTLALNKLNHELSENERLFKDNTNNTVTVITGFWDY